MRKVQKEEPKTNTELKEVLVLWKKTSKGGVDYLTGYTTDSNEEKTQLVGFFNRNQRSETEPIIHVYIDNDSKEQSVEVVTLWESISKNNTKYLTGKDNEDKRVVGFYNTDENSNKPYIRVYYK